MISCLQIQELKANELQVLTLKGEASETQKQLKQQGLTLSKIEMENLNLAQKLHENLEEMKSVIKERDNLKRMEEMLKMERDQLKENLRDSMRKVSCVPSSCLEPPLLESTGSIDELSLSLPPSFVLSLHPSFSSSFPLYLPSFLSSPSVSPSLILSLSPSSSPFLPPSFHPSLVPPTLPRCMCVSVCLSV